MGQPGKSLKVLVVEDSEDDYDLLVHFLQRAGYSVDALRVDGERGLAAALSASAWDLVISDHQLPGFSSQEALAQVRALPQPPPFIIVSGTIGEAVAVDAMLAGAADFVLKGNLARLPPAIERSLAQSAERSRHALTEAARRESEARLTGIARNLPGVLLRLGYDSQTGAISLPYISEGTLPLFGRKAATLMASPEHFILGLHAKDRAEFLLHVAAAASARTGISWEGRLDAQGSSLRWVLIVASLRANGAEISWDGLLTDLTPQKLAENEVRESRSRLRELSAHLEEVKELERAEAAREIHDDLGGLLTGLKVDINWLRRHASGLPGAQAKIADMAMLTDEMAQGVRRVARALRPAILDQGLVAGIEWLARDFRDRTGFAVSFESNVEDVALGTLEATALFRAVQESLTNIAKHAQARKVEVQVFVHPTEVSIEVHDDGRGIEAGDRRRDGSFGLRGMEERLRHLGGWIDVAGEPGRGTTVMLFMPLAAAKAAP